MTILGKGIHFNYSAWESIPKYFAKSFGGKFSRIQYASMKFQHNNKIAPGVDQLLKPFQCTGFIAFDIHLDKH